KEILAFVTKEQAQSRLNNQIHTFADICWDKCITGTPGSRFARGEEACLTNCVERFLDTSLFMVKQIQQRQQLQHTSL
ncbi:Tim10/DDP family zinc finger protein, partial [Melanogaster broomeanus]